MTSGKVGQLANLYFGTKNLYFEKTLANVSNKNNFLLSMTRFHSNYDFTFKQKFGH